MKAQRHGGLLDREIETLHVTPSRIADFSVNVNPYGPHPAVARAARAADLTRYPDPTARAVRVALGTHLRVSPDRLVLGNGAAELMWSLARALLVAGDVTLIVEPTFSELPSAAIAAGARIAAWRARAGDRFAVDAAAVSAAVRVSGARLAYLCTPNNPTGAHFPAREVAALARRHPETTWIVDQAFLPLSPHHDEGATRFPANVVTLRSLTKDHAIPGLRIGYLVTTAAIAARIEAARAPWTTSSPAQAAALATLRTGDFVARSRDRLLADRDALAASLRSLGLDPLPSSAPFLLVDVGHATRLKNRLLENHRVLVRDGTSFGLPRHVRLAGRPAKDRARLVRALRAELPLET